MLQYTTPFKHILIDDFLTPENFKKTEEVYRTNQFNLKYTDLFKFLQTDELANESNLNFFKFELSKIFNSFISTEDTFYTIFASYYRKGDFLSCHDDMVDGRLYAFTYYLSDLDTGDLILFNNECTEEFKRIGIKKNRLVIFEVSDISWHEVDICASNGRMAITGWLNNQNKIKLKKAVFEYTLPDNIEYVDFDLDLSDNIVEFDGLEYNFDYSSKISDCVYSMRRFTNILLNTCIALDIPKYKLIYFNSCIIDYRSYLLLNDSINLLTGDLIDIFIISCDEEQKGNIKIVNEDGELIRTLNIKKNVMYAIKREKMKFFIERAVCEKEYFLLHLIYRRLK